MITGIVIGIILCILLGFVIRIEVKKSKSEEPCEPSFAEVCKLAKEHKEEVEYLGEPVFDWFEFLLKKDKTFDDWSMAAKLAGSWISCACGNQCHIIPRNSLGKPLDAELSRLGYQFYTNIGWKDEDRALRTLVLIEKRSQHLINEIREKEQSQAAW